MREKREKCEIERGEKPFTDLSLSLPPLFFCKKKGNEKTNEQYTSLERLTLVEKEGALRVVFFLKTERKGQ